MTKTRIIAAILFSVSFLIGQQIGAQITAVAAPVEKTAPTHDAGDICIDCLLHHSIDSAENLSANVEDL